MTVLRGSMIGPFVVVVEEDDLDEVLDKRKGRLEEDEDKEGEKFLRDQLQKGVIWLESKSDRLKGSSSSLILLIEAEGRLTGGGQEGDGAEKGNKLELEEKGIKRREGWDLLSLLSRKQV